MPRTVRLNKVLGSLRIRNPERNAASPVRKVNRPRKTVKNGQNYVAKSLFCPKINQKRSINERFLLEYEGLFTKIKVTRNGEASRRSIYRSQHPVNVVKIIQNNDFV